MPNGTDPLRPKKPLITVSPLVWAVIVVALLLIAASVFVPGLRDHPLGKMFAAVSMTLLAATIVFSLFPVDAALAVKLPAAIAGAAGFFFALLPVLLETLFTSTISGIVTYEGSLEGVRGVRVELAGGHSTSTDSTGRFTLIDTPKNVTSFTVHYGDQRLEVPVNVQRRYAVIAKFVTVRTQRELLAEHAWAQGTAGACAARGDGAVPARLYILDRSIAPSRASWTGRDVKGVFLHVEVGAMLPAQITWAQMTRPPTAAKGNSDPGSARHRWIIESPASEERVRVQACVVEAHASGPVDLETTYWLEGTEKVSGGTVK